MENREVEAAMVQYGNALDNPADRATLRQRSLDLAKACRLSLDRSWGINAWNDPDRAAGSALESSTSP